MDYKNFFKTFSDEDLLDLDLDSYADAVANYMNDIQKKKQSAEEKQKAQAQHEAELDEARNSAFYAIKDYFDLAEIECSNEAIEDFLDCAECEDEDKDDYIATIKTTVKDGSKDPVTTTMHFTTNDWLDMLSKLF